MTASGIEPANYTGYELTVVGKKETAGSMATFVNHKTENKQQQQHSHETVTVT